VVLVYACTWVDETRLLVDPFSVGGSRELPLVAVVFGRPRPAATYAPTTSPVLEAGSVLFALCPVCVVPVDALSPLVDCELSEVEEVPLVESDVLVDVLEIPSAAAT